MLLVIYFSQFLVLILKLNVIGLYWWLLLDSGIIFLCILDIILLFLDVQIFFEGLMLLFVIYLFLTV